MRFLPQGTLHRTNAAQISVSHKPTPHSCWKEWRSGKHIPVSNGAPDCQVDWTGGFCVAQEWGARFGGSESGAKQAVIRDRAAESVVVQTRLLRLESLTPYEGACQGPPLRGSGCRNRTCRMKLGRGRLIGAEALLSCLHTGTTYSLSGSPHI